MFGINMNETENNGICEGNVLDIDTYPLAMRMNTSEPVDGVPKPASILEQTAPKYVDPDLTFLLELAMLDLPYCEEVKQSLLSEDLCISCTIMNEEESLQKMT
jgi:hypothetical protein